MIFMRKVISMITVFVLCFTLAVPAFASSVGFVPSITAKPAPEVVVGGKNLTLDGTSADDIVDMPVIEVKNENQEVVYEAPVVELVVTAVSQVQADDSSLVISEEAAEILKEAYEQLNDEDFRLAENIPEQIEQLKDMGLDEENVNAAVVTALFDVTVLTEELETYLAEEGHTVDLTFKADVPAGHTVVVMVYKESKWQLIENVAVNGDGTITCTFAHFCPVAILTVPMAVEAAEETVAAEAATEAAPEAAPEAAADAAVQPAEDNGGFAWWWIVLVAVVAVAGVVLKSKGSKKGTEAK